MSEINFKAFPTTRYQGSKRKILPWIYENIKDLEFNSVLDACGGSASVSYLFKKMSKEVTYNDKLKFNSIIGKALIQNQRVKFLDEDYANLFEWIANNDTDGFIESTFSAVYYPRRENQWLDGLNHGILNMNHYHGQTLEYKKSLAYYALFQACLIKRPFNLFHRKNLNIRTRNVERNFGNKTTWEKSFESHFKNFIDEANKYVFDSGVTCRSINRSVFKIDNVYDLVYIDPPYFGKEGISETSNYLKCYHFLEGIANYNRWEDMIDFDSPNLRFKKIDEKNEFKKENIIEVFDELIRRFSDSKIVFSYKIGGTPSFETLVKIMKSHKRKVYTRSMEYAYALNRQNDNRKTNREVLIIGV